MGIVGKSGQWRRRKKNGITAVAALIIFALGAGFACAQEQSKEMQPIRIAVPVDSHIGITAAQMVIFYENMTKAIMPKLRIPVTLIRLTGKENQWENDILELLNQGKADFGFLTSPVFVAPENKDKVSGLIPIATFTVNDSPYLIDCIFVRKADGLASVKELEHKVWGGYSILDTRRTFFENKVDKPLDQFFDQLLYIENYSVANLGYLLLMGTIDAFGGTEIEMRLNQMTDESLAGIVPIACGPGALNSIIVARPDLDQDVIDKVIDILYSAHDDPDFKLFRQIFDAINARIVPVDEDFIKKSKELYKLYENRGWNKEQAEFIEKNSN